MPRFTALALSNNGKYAATATNDHGIQFWTLPADKPEHQLNEYDIGQPVNDIAFSPNTASLAAACMTGIKHWPLDGYPPISDDINTGQPVTALASSRDGQAWAFTSSLPNSASSFVAFRFLPKWSARLSSGTVKKGKGHSDQVTAIALIDDDRVMVSGSRDETVRLWSVATGSEIDRIDVGTPVNAIAVSPDETKLLIATDDEIVQVFDVKTKTATAQLAGHDLLVLDVNWSDDGRYFVSASADKTLRIWDADTLETVRVLNGHTNRVNAAVLTTYGRYAVSGSDDFTVRFWDLEAESEIAVFDGHAGSVQCVAVNKFGTQAVSAGWDGTIRVWDLEYTNWNSANTQDKSASRQ